MCCLSCIKQPLTLSIHTNQYFSRSQNMWMTFHNVLNIVTLSYLECQHENKVVIIICRLWCGHKSHPKKNAFNKLQVCHKLQFVTITQLEDKEERDSKRNGAKTRAGDGTKCICTESLKTPILVLFHYPILPDVPCLMTPTRSWNLFYFLEYALYEDSSIFF